jgi:hypothetical protein
MGLWVGAGGVGRGPGSGAGRRGGGGGAGPPRPPRAADHRVCAPLTPPAAAGTVEKPPSRHTRCHPGAVALPPRVRLPQFELCAHSCSFRPVAHPQRPCARLDTAPGGPPLGHAGAPRWGRGWAKGGRERAHDTPGRAGPGGRGGGAPRGGRRARPTESRRSRGAARRPAPRALLPGPHARLGLMRAPPRGPRRGRPHAQEARWR